VKRVGYDKTLRELRILIVDDEQANVTLLERLLRRAGYSRIESTTDPTLVFGLCERAKPDLLMLDVHMPHLDGFEVMSQLQPLLAGDRIPILLLTGDATAEARRRALSLGARDFLNKPLDQVEVLLRVDNLLETRGLQLQLEHQNRAKDRFLASVSHELRTPLNAILGFSGTLLMGLPGPINGEQAKQLRTVQSSAKHLLSLINDLLDLARIEAGNPE
jgi:putative two-component system response regulator